jgi:hypothetical protein
VSLQARERVGETARSTATSTFTIYDLLDELELSGKGSVSTTRRRGPAGERKWGESKWARGEASRGGLELYTDGVSLV